MKKNIKAITSRARIKDIMSKNLITIDQTSTAFEAIALMEKHHISTLIVVHNQQSVGMFTERDVVKLIAAKKDPKKMSMLRAMTNKIVSVPMDTPLLKASEIMKEHHIRKLLVKNDEEEIIGIVTQTDIVHNLNIIYQNYKSVLYNPWLTIALAFLIIILFIVRIVWFP